MQYNYRHKTQDTRHKHWQLYVLILLKKTLVKLLRLILTLTLNYPALSQLYYLLSKHLLKVPLGLIAVLLLPYSVNTHALSATTAQVINGNKPYLTFDNGLTKVTTTDGLLGITLSDGTRVTPANNTSAITPIELPNAGETLAKVQMLVPITADSIDLNDLIGAPYNYWGDDDGDGQGTNGITATGNLSVSITDNTNQAVSRSASLDICKAPYKVVLTSTNGSLVSQYGLPNSSNFSSGTATYYISPKAASKICYARPNLNFSTGELAGPDTIWSPTKGFLVQSTEPSTYSSNFPTMGANKLHFDLLVKGIDVSTLTWPAVTQGNITVTMTLNPPKSSEFNPDGASSVRVTLNGPAATSSQISSASPGRVSIPNLPQQFELVGYDSNHTAVLKYGFVLKQWFINRGNKYDTYSNHSSWCINLGGGYHVPQIKDLTNAVCSGTESGWWCQGAVGATPSSSANFYQRNIGAGLFTEWGSVYDYTAAGFVYDYYWPSESRGSDHFAIDSSNGYVGSGSPNRSYYGVCTYP